MDLFPPSGPRGYDVETLLEKADYWSRALHHHQDALDLLDSLGSTATRQGANLPARRAIGKAAVLERQGELTEAVRYYGEALRMLEGTRDKTILTACLEGLARCQHAQGQLRDVRAHLLRALELALEANDPAGEERIRRKLGRLAEEDNRLEEAWSWYSESLRLASAQQDWAGALDDLTHLAVLGAKLERRPEQERFDWERRRMLDDLGELAYAGPSAAARPPVIDAARALLRLDDQDIPGSTTHDDLWAATDHLYRQATVSRKQDLHRHAVPLYRSALIRYELLDQPGNSAVCLNGLGLSYQALAKETIRQELLAMREAQPPSLDLTSLWRLSYRLLHGKGRDLAEQARACHRWSLELHKATGSLAGQANQVSNLALVEELLGNLDTARRYQLWALHVHRAAGKSEDAAIDLIKLADLERRLGDDEAAETWQRQERELSHAT